MRCSLVAAVKQTRVYLSRCGMWLSQSAGRCSNVTGTYIPTNIPTVLALTHTYACKPIHFIPLLHCVRQPGRACPSQSSPPPPRPDLNRDSGCLRGGDDEVHCSLPVPKAGLPPPFARVPRPRRSVVCRKRAPHLAVARC